MTRKHELFVYRADHVAERDKVRSRVIPMVLEPRHLRQGTDCEIVPSQ
jgi:hypothetical protein